MLIVNSVKGAAKNELKQCSGSGRDFYTHSHAIYGTIFVRNAVKSIKRWSPFQTGSLAYDQYKKTFSEYNSNIFNNLNNDQIAGLLYLSAFDTKIIDATLTAYGLLDYAHKRFSFSTLKRLTRDYTDGSQTVNFKSHSSNSSTANNSANFQSFWFSWPSPHNSFLARVPVYYNCGH